MMIETYTTLHELLDQGVINKSDVLVAPDRKIEIRVTQDGWVQKKITERKSSTVISGFRHWQIKGADGNIELLSDRVDRINKRLEQTDGN